MTNVKKIALTTLIFLFTAAAVAIGFVIDFKRYADTPRDLGREELTVTIAAGDPFSKTISGLVAAGVVEHPRKFKLLARFTGDDKRLKAGEYGFSGRLSPREVIAVLVEGAVKLYRLTIPEGYHLFQVAEAVQAAGFDKADRFVELATGEDRVLEFKVGGKTLEGYLFPDTYFFPKGADASMIITAMVNRFHEVFSQRWRARAAELDLTVHEVVTLASIIEKETGAAHERELISSVFHNRLKKGMRLEADPTVIYGLKTFDGNLTREHLKTPTPYNTYTNRGLPPGPIANPGKAALRAALFPADSDYLFFVARRDGTHAFSTNLRDHQAAVRKYQLRRKKRE
jgi:UPF0755 protein